MPSTILFLDLFNHNSRLANPHVCTPYKCKNKTNIKETHAGCALKAIFVDNWLQFLFSAHNEMFLVSDQLADVLQKSVLTFFTHELSMLKTVNHGHFIVYLNAACLRIISELCGCCYYDKKNFEPSLMEYIYMCFFRAQILRHWALRLQWNIQPSWSSGH